MKTFHVWLKDREVPIVVEGETAADDDNGLKIKDSEKKVIAQFWGKELQGWTEAKPKS